MIRCPNCSSVLPELESQGLSRCPQCQCELAPAGLPPLPGFDLETAAPTRRSPTIFGLTSVGQDDPLSSSNIALEPLAGTPSGAPHSSTAHLPGLPSIDDDASLPALPSLNVPSAAPSSQPRSQTQRNPAINFGQDEGSGLPTMNDLPALSMDLPGISAPRSPAPALNLELDLPSPSADLPSPQVDLPIPSADLPALSGSLPTTPAMSSSLPATSRSTRAGDLNEAPPPPPGSAHYQRPASSRRSGSAALAQDAGAQTGGVQMTHSPQLRRPRTDARAKLKRALARNAPDNDDFLPGIGDLDLDLAPEPQLERPRAAVPAANSAAILPEDLPETVAALDLSTLTMPEDSEPISTRSSPTTHGPSPAPRIIEADKKRWPLFLGSSIGVLAIAAAASWHFGLLADFGLDLNSPQDTLAELSVPFTPEAFKNEEPESDSTPGTLKAPSKPFIAALFSDAPLNAETLAKAKKNGLGEIEAQLYFGIQNPSRTKVLAPASLQALAQWEKDPAVYVQRVVGLAHLYQGQLEQAKARFAQAASTPQGAIDPLLSLYNALLAYEQGEVPRSIELVRALALRTPELKRAELLLQVWSQGLPHFAQIKPNVPAWEGLVAQAAAGDAPTSHAYSVANALFEQGEWANAHKISEHYRSEAKIPKELHRWEVLSAKVMGAQGQLLASRNALTNLLKTEPNRGDAVKMLWDLFYESEQYKKLDESVYRWIKDHPSDVMGRIMQARSLAAQGEGSTALLLLSHVNNHLVSNTPLMPPLLTDSADPEFKKIRAKANASAPAALMKVTPNLGKVGQERQALAAASARAQAEILARRMAVKAANAAFGVAAHLDPQNPGTPIAQSSMLVKAGQFPRALAVLEGAGANLATHASAQANRARAELLAHQARLARNEGKRKLARRKMAEAQAVDPQNPHIALFRANVLLQSGQENQAEARFAKLAQRTGDMPGLMAPLAQIYLRRGQLDKLDALIRPLLKATDVSVDTLVTGARLKVAQDDLMPALALASRALKQAPNNWEAHLVKAQVLVARGDLDGALGELSEFKPKNPNPKYELWLGKVKDAQGDLESAYGHYRLASNLDKSSVEPRVLQAKILARRGNAQKAISMLKPILKRKRATADVFLAMGIAHRDLRKPKKAVGFFRRAQSKAPGSYVAFYEEGRIASNHNRHDQVIRSMDRALAANAPAMPARMRLDALRRLGRAYIETRNFNRAEEVLSRYLIEAPRDDAGRGAVMRMMESL